MTSARSRGATGVKAIMLAAGVGSRLNGTSAEESPPKALLRFDGTTLLRRHVEILRAHGIERLVLVVGHGRAAIEAEIDAIGARDFVTTIINTDYRRGSVVSLWHAGAELTGGTPCLFMDADVLYHPRLIGCLLSSRHGDCLPVDRDFEAGDDPVMVCVRDGRIVEFRKRATGAFDSVGEWPGFMRLSGPTAGRLARALDAMIAEGRLDEAYEEAMRRVMVGPDAVPFGVEDVTGLPWVEIDFPEDLARARTEVLPRLRGDANAGTRPTPRGERRG
ncbi:MAG: phosphocholine cytidylyltransferase family protein [Alphaproteobacteria bacterium]